MTDIPPSNLNRKLQPIFGLREDIYRNEPIYRKFTEVNVDTLKVDEYLINGVLFNDSVNTYKLNSRNYRSPEFEAGTELVTLGCSQTFGCGVPQDEMWPAKLAEYMGVSYANLANVGSNPREQVHRFYAYVEEFGLPKYVALLMPEYSRYLYPLRYDVNTVNGYYPEDSGGWGSSVESVVLPKPPYGEMDAAYYAKYSKRPHDLAEVLSYEWPFYETMMSIYNLSVFCRAAGVSLVYGTWDDDLEKILIDKKSSYPHISRFELREFVDISLRELDRIGCHSDYVTEYGENWSRGMDGDENGHGRHMGIHYHWHIARAFLDKYKADNHES